MEARASRAVLCAATCLPKFNLVPGTQARKFKFFFYGYESTKVGDYQRRCDLGLWLVTAASGPLPALLISGARAFSSREGRWDHLNCFKCLRVKSSLLNPRAFKFHRETCSVRLNEAGPTESQYSPKSKHSLRIQGQSERMPCPSPPPTSRLPSKTAMVTRLPQQVDCVSWQTLELIFNQKLID